DIAIFVFAIFGRYFKLSRKLLCKRQLHSCKDRRLVCNSYMLFCMLQWLFGHFPLFVVYLY
ncbi:unnamed protein product, partial [Brassica oleracea var. botrytis]